MGSPLGPLFANFYMSHIESIVLNNTEIAPYTYLRYVDDCFLDVKDTQQLEKLISELERNSVLHFTYELSNDNTLPFLDVLVERGDRTFITSVYRKPTHTGQTLNPNSECPERYKTSVIRSFVRRAIRTSSTHQAMHLEFSRLKQLLVNNGFANQDIDTEIRRQLENIYGKNTPRPDQTQTTHHLYYRNFMNSSYQTDEKILTNIIKKNIRCRENTDIKLHIYYQTAKTRHLVMTNNPTKTGWLKSTNVVYQFDCPNEGCRLRNIHYVGYTLTTLSRRLTMHLQEGAPKDHFHQTHNTKITRNILVDNTKIIHRNNDPTKVEIAEALIIQEHTPPLNSQKNIRMAKLSLWGVQNV